MDENNSFKNSYGPGGPNPYGPGGSNPYGSGNYGPGPGGPNPYGPGPGNYGPGLNPYGGVPVGPHGKRTGSGMAIAAMACGIAALALFLTVINIPLAIVAIVLGIVYLVNYEPVDRGFAITGIVTGILSFVLLIAGIAVIMTSPLMRHLEAHPPTQDEIIEEYNDVIEDYYRDMFGDDADFY